MNIGRGFPIELHQPDDDVIAFFSFLERQHSHAAVTELEQREFFAQRTCVFGAIKCYQRLVEAIGLPVALGLPPITSMTRQAIDEFVMTQVLGELVAVSTAISFAQARRIYKGE